jgi:hypothetical protein
MNTYCINVRNVNEGLNYGLLWLANRGEVEETRNGPVLASPMPVATCFYRPCERVLFSSMRDANPFFHFMEGLWMLAGRNDVAFPTQFNARFAEYSDNGQTFHGAYGFRWRQYFGYDQLDTIIDELRRNPSTRRAVLAMWDGGCWGEEDSGTEPPAGDLNVAIGGGKDVPCNTHVYFRIREGKLVMMVNNRSNDIVWGTFGANAVHMSMMHEYVARCVGVQVGSYYQSSFNFHAYTDIYPKERWKELANDALMEDLYTKGSVAPYPLMSVDKETWDTECGDFVDFGLGSDPAGTAYTEPLFQEVAVPMLRAWQAHKVRDYSTALSETTKIAATDWREACYSWMKRRRETWERKNVG